MYRRGRAVECWRNSPLSYTVGLGLSNASQQASRDTIPNESVHVLRSWEFRVMINFEGKRCFDQDRLHTRCPARANIDHSQF